MLPKIQRVIPKKWKVEAWLLPEPLIKKRKHIPQISNKKKLRIQQGWGEWPLFLLIWEEREHNCECCGKRLYTPRPHNFDHLKPKSGWEEYRLDKTNIKITCFPCHYMKTHWWTYNGIDYDAA